MKLSKIRKTRLVSATNIFSSRKEGRVAVHFRVRNRRTKRSCCFEALYALLTFNTATPDKFLSLLKYCVAMRVRKLKQLLGKDHKKSTVRFENRGGEEEGNAQGENLVVILMKRTAYQYGS